MIRNYTINSKTRRHSGRYIPTIYDPVNLPYEETKWNDWNDYRDGMRRPRRFKKSTYRRDWVKKVRNCKRCNGTGTYILSHSKKIWKCWVCRGHGKVILA